jgi:hypothetical protein
MLVPPDVSEKVRLLIDGLVLAPVGSEEKGSKTRKATNRHPVKV